MTADDELEIWGTKTDALPQRPVTADELRPLADEPRVEQIRVPTEDGAFADHPGPIIGGKKDNTISKFILVMTGEKVVQFQFGWPEVITGELQVPQDPLVARAEGYIAWRQAEMDLESIDRFLGEAEASTDDSLTAFFFKNTVPLCSPKVADD